MWIRQLQLIQITAARVLTKTSRVDHLSPAVRCLHWPPVCQRTNLKIQRLVYKAEWFISDLLLHMKRPDLSDGLVQVCLHVKHFELACS